STERIVSAEVVVCIRRSHSGEAGRSTGGLRSLQSAARRRRLGASFCCGGAGPPRPAGAGGGAGAACLSGASAALGSAQCRPSGAGLDPGAVIESPTWGCALSASADRDRIIFGHWFGLPRLLQTPSPPLRQGSRPRP